MPSYSFRNDETNEEFDMTLSLSEREAFLQNNPNITQIIKRAPSIGDSVRLGLRKPDDGFRDVLRNVKDHHPGSRKTKNTINDF